MEGEEALIRANATKERVLAIFFENTTFMKNTCQNLFYHEVHLPFVFIPFMIPLPKVYFLITDELQKSSLEKSLWSGIILTRIVVKVMS